jgi:hypothetical protein
VWACAVSECVGGCVRELCGRVRACAVRCVRVRARPAHWMPWRASGAPEGGDRHRGGDEAAEDQEHGQGHVAQAELQPRGRGGADEQVLLLPSQHSVRRILWWGLHRSRLLPCPVPLSLLTYPVSPLHPSLPSSWPDLSREGVAHREERERHHGHHHLPPAPPRIPRTTSSAAVEEDTEAAAAAGHTPAPRALGAPVVHSRWGGHLIVGRATMPRSAARKYAHMVKTACVHLRGD